MTSGAGAPATPALMKLLDEAAELARRFGSDPQFSRGGGGNISVKADGIMHIKPSGVALKAITADALMPLETEPLLRLLETASDDGAMAGSQRVMAVAMAARLHATGAQRPSVEVLFHVLTPRRFVLHTHPTIVNALCCSRDGARIAHGLFGDDVLWVPYADPGLPLARAISGARRRFEESTGRTAPDVVLLENHGLIVAADEPLAIADAATKVVATVRERLEALGARGSRRNSRRHHPRGAGEKLVAALGPVLRGSLSSGPRLKVVTYDDSPEAVRLASSAEGRGLVMGGPLTPDQIVYAGSWPLWLDLAPVDASQMVETVHAALARHVAAHGALPSIVVVAQLGVLAAGDTIRQADTARDICIDAIRVGFGALQLGGVRAMAPEERRFIEDWEAEDYRRRMDAGGSSEGSARGMVVLVTNAAMGLGPQLTAQLSADGADVLAIDDQLGAAAIAGVVRRYGGFDLLVVNRAVGSTDQRGMSELLDAGFPVLGLQRAAHPGYRSAVIEVLTDAAITPSVPSLIGARAGRWPSESVALTSIRTDSPFSVLETAYEAVSG